MEKIDRHNYEAFLLDYIEGNLDDAAIVALFAFLEEHPELKPDPEDLDIIPTTIASAASEELSFEDKLSLKHIPEEIEEKIVAYLEGQLSDKEKADFERGLHASEFMQKTLAAYQKTYLVAGEETFAAKMHLKRTAITDETIIAYLEGQLNPAEKTAFEKALTTDEVALFTLNAYKQTRLEADASVVYPNKESLKREAKVVRLFTYQNVLAIAASLVLLFGLFWLLSPGSTNLQSEGSVALKKSKRHDKHHTGTVAVQDTSIASNSAIHKGVHQPGIQKQEVIQPENNTPQQIANNQVTPVDTSKGKIGPVLKNIPAVEPRSLIALNPYNETDIDSTGAQPASRPRFKTTEYVAEQINKAAWGEEEENTKALSPEKKKVKGFDVLALLGKGLKKLGNQRSDARKIEDKEKDYTEYVVTIGSLSVSRKVAN